MASGFCPAHDPDRLDANRAARARGGKGKSRLARVERLVPASLRHLLATLLDAVEDTRQGALDPKVATAMASLAGAVVRVYQSATTEQQLADLQRQLDDLRSASGTPRTAA
jgi:hypothetical protein